MKAIILGFAALLSVAFSSAGKADTIIGNGGVGSGVACCFGDSAYGTAVSAGQTITVPSDNVLQSFSFYAEGGTFRAVVAEWYAQVLTGQYQSGVVGPILYQSPAISGTGTLTQYTFNTGALTLDPENRAILFLVAEQDNSWFKIGAYGGPNLPDSYTGGQFETSPDGVSWISPVSNGYLDASFSADFSPAVPETSTWAMLLIGFAGIGFYRRSRKTATSFNLCAR
jgi:hypothetical protein